MAILPKLSGDDTGFGRRHLRVQHLGVAQLLRDAETVDQEFGVRAQLAAAVVDGPGDGLGAFGGQETVLDEPRLVRFDDRQGVQVAHQVQNLTGALIGAGSFGSVFLGMNPTMGSLMAVKQVELPTGKSHNEERKKSMLEALEHEIELLKVLQHESASLSLSLASSSTNRYRS